MHDQFNDTALEPHVLKTLLYFDIFNYPLKSEEVFRFLPVNSVTEKDVVASLNALVGKKIIFNTEDLYSIQNNAALIPRRRNGNVKAEAFVPVAKQQAVLIGSFPFVRAVMASGSLSKNYMDENSDLDFFIVTAPGRLWIARTLLVIYKRLFLFNSHKHFCVNYFIDATHLEIEEKNQFTATELATVIPLYNAELYNQLIKANGWIKKFFPNMKIRETDCLHPLKTSALKRISERLLNISFLENLCQQLTFKRWKRIYQKNYSSSDFRIAFKTTKHVSKNHPNQYQRKVIDLYDQRLSEFSSKHNIVL
jgi:hypothetical protein